MYDLIVIGGGPAGLTAMIYAIRKRLNVLMLSKDLGGKTNFTLSLPWMEDYDRSGFGAIRGLEVVNKFRNELAYLVFAHRLEAVKQVCREDGWFRVETEGKLVEAKAVIVATGAKQQLLRVPGEREFMMHGLCYSAISYAPLFIDHTAVVIGSGALALRSTAELATIARHVDLVWTADQYAASPLADRVQSAENVSIIQGFQVTEFTGDRYATAVHLMTKEGRTMSLAADGFFVEQALIPNTQMVADIVELDAEGRIRVDCSNRTSTPGLFAAGDAATGPSEQVLIAVGEGAKAALSAYEYLLSMP